MLGESAASPSKFSSPSRSSSGHLLGEPREPVLDPVRQRRHQKPPLRPEAPKPAVSASSTTTSRAGSSAFAYSAAHRPGEAAADDAQVGVGLRPVSAGRVSSYVAQPERVRVGVGECGSCAALGEVVGQASELGPASDSPVAPVKARASRSSTEVAAQAPDELEPDRQPVVGKPGRNRHGRVRGDGDP